MPLKRRNLLFLSTLISCFIGIFLFTSGCADEPSSLGLNFIPPNDTEGVKVFDSYLDSMQITSTNHRKFTNTSGSPNLMVGKNGNYDSKALLRFGVDTGYANATVNSASLILKYRNYYFPTSHSDSLGQISFDIYKIQKSLDLSRITLDSVNNSTFGTVSQGNYTGIPTADSQEVSVNLNTVMVKDWLKAASDTGYAVKNYGIVLSPGNSSNVIKAFYSASSQVIAELKPKLFIIVTKNSVVDTLQYNPFSSLSLVNNPTIAQTNEIFYMQAGIAYIQVLKFDLSKIPSTATINDVQLYFTLDQANSIFSSQTAKELRAAKITDTAGLVTENFTFIGSPPTTDNKYSIRLVSNFNESPFQKWLMGEVNYGLYVYPTNIQTNLDLFAFYNITASDHTKRPRIVIKYTPRKTP